MSGRAPSAAIVVAILVAALAICASSASAALPTGNLLVNPAAEARPVPEGGVRGTPAGWTQHATLDAGTQAAYDSCYGGSVEERDVLERGFSEAIDGGARFFFAGEAPISDLWQEVAVAPADAEGQRLLIGGDFGGYEDQEDTAALSAIVFDASGDEIALIETAPVTAADRGEQTGFVRREASAPLPPGAALIRFVLVQNKADGSDSDGYADNLFATFDATAPAPPVPTGDSECPLATSVTPPPAGGGATTGTPPPSPSPAVQIASGPPHESGQSAAPFSFTGTPGGSYECSVDGGAWQPCASGKDFGPVAPGDHRFEVRERLGSQTSAAASYRWTVDLPRQCVLRVARARVFTFAAKNRVRLVIHYTSYRPAKVSVSYRLQGSRGALPLGSATTRFTKAGVFRLPENLAPAAIGKARAAKSLLVQFKIPGTPSSCGRFYKKRLTIPRKISGQTVWFQSDSLFAPGGATP